MFAVHCSSVDYALAISSPPFLLDLIFSLKFSESIFLFLKKNPMTPFKSPFLENGSLYFFTFTFF